MASVLTEASRVTCGHTPGAVTTKGNARLTVEGQAVLTKEGILTRPVSGCSTVASTGTNACTSVAAVVGGAATKLFVDGKPAMLEGVAGGTDGVLGGTPAQTLSARALQTRLTAS